jgi:cytosine/adenosine deaminase-related metal-dependent hydrolase
MKALLNATTYDFNEFKENQYILFDGTIIETGSMTDYKNNNHQEIDALNHLVMPGLVNGHSHIYSTFSRGLSVPYNPKNFQEILDQLWWKLDRNLDNISTYYSGIVSGIEYLKHGVTTIIDHHASGEIMGSLTALKKAVSEDVGLRGIYCFESSDRFDVPSCTKENISFIELNKTNKSRGLFGMHAQFTLSDDSLRDISTHNNHPIHIHVAESEMDQNLCLEQHNKRVVERLNDFNLITKNSILVHGLYLNQSELDIIRRKEAVIALNVTSNMNNGVGLPHYNLYKDNDIKVIIGNDGISNSMASEYRNLFFAMHHKGETPTSFMFDDLIRIINNTYRYANDILETKLGKIKKNYQADLIVLPFNPIAKCTIETIFGYLLFGDFQDFVPKDVFVCGRQILSNYNVSNELQIKYNESKNIAKELWNKIEKEGML